ncbi:MAG: hypothetical protein ABIZ34_01700, partial [Candidatus Limnocylindrales bacterium]
AAARYLEARGDEEVAPVLASHYVEAYRASSEGAEAEALAAQARVALRAAADRATQLNAHDQAFQLLEQALVVTPGEADQAALREAAGEAAASAGRGLEALHRFESAAAWYEAHDDVSNTRMQVRMANLEIYAGKLDPAIARLEPIATRISGVSTPEAAHVFAELGRAYYLAGNRDQAMAMTDRAIELAERFDELAPLVDALITKGSALADIRPREGRAILAGAIGLADTYGLPSEAARGRNNLAVFLDVEDPQELQRVIREALRLAERAGNRALVDLFTIALAFGLFNRGDRQGATETLRGLEGRDLFPTTALETEWLRGRLAAASGDQEAVERSRAERARLLEEISNPQYVSGDAVNQAWEAIFAGDMSEGADIARSAVALDAANAFTIFGIAGRAALLASDRLRAQRAVDGLEASPVRGRMVSLMLGELRAGIAALEGRAADAGAAYQEVFRRWREIEMKLDLAIAQLSAARLLGPGSADGRAAGEEARTMFRDFAPVWTSEFLDRLIGTESAPSKPASGAAEPAAEPTGSPTTIARN